MSATIVEIDSGRLEGRSHRGFSTFLGIPYARPPVGELRFRSPRRLGPWGGVRRAHTFGPAAPQLAGAGTVARVARWIGAPIGEDCLYLNVWTPSARPARARPAMVWIHGGGFFLGAGSRFLYSGAELAAKFDVVVVSLNYRLGALGFLDFTAWDDRLREAEPSANLGIQDQIAALEWVRRNISAFGGDPDNVTVFGESAGAMSIGTLMSLDTGLFRRAILQSGAAANVSSAGQAEEVARSFLEVLGLAEPDLALLRRLPLRQLLAAQRKLIRLAVQRRINRLPWQPSVDGKLLREKPIAAIARGGARGIDLMIGTNREEWRLFTAGVFQARWMRPQGLKGRVANWLRRRGLSEEAAEPLIEAYRRSITHRKPNPFDIWAMLRTDEVFRFPAVDLAEAHSKTARTFMYRFDFPIPLLPKGLGACHAAELPLVFGSYRHPLLKPVYLGSRKAARLSETLQQAWTSFAHDGQPRSAALPGWEPYETARRRTMVLAQTSLMETTADDEPRRLVSIGNSR